MSPTDPPLRYHIHVFWSDEDQCWVADAPDLRYCSAHGKTPVQAVAELETAMAAWLETARERGLPIPPARHRPPLAS
jgi:predicted RNase H-like HicB family nuclease